MALANLLGIGYLFLYFQCIEYNCHIYEIACSIIIAMKHFQTNRLFLNYHCIVFWNLSHALSLSQCWYTCQGELVCHCIDGRLALFVQMMQDITDHKRIWSSANTGVLSDVEMGGRAWSGIGYGSWWKFSEHAMCSSERQDYNWSKSSYSW